MTKDEEFRNFISEIKARADCRDIFRRFWPDKYRERGNSLCPFHEDSDPSMQLTEDLAYCHGEALSLDAIDLYVRGAGCSKAEAIRLLGKELGLEHPSDSLQQKRPLSNSGYFRKRMQEAVQRGLPDEAIRYLEGRCISPGTIQKLAERKLIGWDTKYNAIAFPLSDWNGTEIIGIQVIPIDGSDKRFIKGTDSKRAFFRFGYGENFAVFSEGIVDALSIAEASANAEGIALLAAGLTNKLKGVVLPSEPVLFMDNDDAGRKAVAKVLRGSGAVFRLVDWTLAPAQDTKQNGSGKAMKDANDLLKAGHATIIETMVSTSRRPTEEEAREIISRYGGNRGKGSKSNGPGDSDSEEKRETQAQQLIKLALDAQYFYTPDELIYGTISINDHQETWHVRSKSFRRWLSREFYHDQGRPPGSQAIYDALNVIEAKAQFEGPRTEVFMRVGKLEDNLYIDLVNDRWEAIEVTPRGWKVIQECPVKFRRTKGMLPLPYPERGGTFNDLKHLLNIPDESALMLVVGWIVQAAHPTGPYPILNLEGEQGSAKTSASRFIRSLIDPSTAPIRTIPREERDLMIAATNAWIVSFDNLSGVPLWLSDALCRLSTGGGFSTRELYSDSEETIFNASRPIVLNGIDQIAARHDLADRAIILNLPAIADEKRIQEKDLQEKFNRMHPRLLGVICESISTALKNHPHTRLPRLPRMADFALWVTAAEPAFPWGPGEFFNAYTRNRKEAIELSLESDPISSAIRELMATRQEWTGTASELLDQLCEHVPEKVQKTSSWPKKPNILSTRLKRSATFLRAVGIEVEFCRVCHERKRTISIRLK